MTWHIVCDLASVITLLVMSAMYAVQSGNAALAAPLVFILSVLVGMSIFH
jgi:hypothetical protein